MNFKEISTLVIAVIGATLGITNFIRSLWKDRVRLKVSPIVLTLLENSTGKDEVVSRVAITVINLSEFPLTITDVGFITNKYFKNAKISSFDNKILHGGKFPYKLAPRTSLTAYHPNPSLFMDDLDKISGAYAITQCGSEIRGSSKTLQKSLRKYRGMKVHNETETTKDTLFGR